MFRPRRFGKYVLTERIAVGGMAEVFRARAPDQRRPVVVKQILPQHARDPKFVDLFVEEAKLSVMLTHPNIVEVRELGRMEDTYFLVMEHVDGRDLGHALQRGRETGRPFEPALAAFVARQACTGLDYAHRLGNARGHPLGVVHRDLTPPNVLLSFDGEVKITDFGIAKAADRLAQTDAGIVRGTQGYMAPEQASGGRVDARADLFTVGVLLWEMLCGERLFASAEDVRTLRAGERPPVRAPSDVASRVPSDLDPIVLRALEGRPQDRWATAADFARALGAWIERSGAEARPRALGAYVRSLFADEPRVEKAEPAVTPLGAGGLGGEVEILASQMPAETERGGRGVLWATVIVLMGLLMLLFARGVERRTPGAEAPGREPPAYGDLTIASMPVGAAVYEFIGTSPVEVPHLDVGQDHEVLVLDEDGGAWRARIPSHLWRPAAAGGGAWRADVHIDLAGPSAPPLDDPGRPRRTYGIARVETAPAGRAVWLLVGYTPHMRIEDLRVDREQRFLVVKEGYEPGRVRVTRGHWQPTDKDMVYETTVELRPLAGAGRRRAW